MKVLCAGLIVCDVLAKPISKEVLEADTSNADYIVLRGGGDAFNVAVNLTSLGVDASLAGRIGEDDLGDWLKRHTETYGVDIKFLKKVAMPSSVTLVLIGKEGDRNLVSYRGACHSFVEEDLPDSSFKDYDIFYLGSAFDLPKLDGQGMTRLFERVKKAGLKIFLDTTKDLTPGDFETLSPALSYVDIFMPSENEARGLTGYTDMEKAADFFHRYGPKIVVIKMGSKGCLVSMEGEKESFPAYKADIVDTTGAGDAFVSGFIAAYVKGYAIADCARIANAAGAICVGQIGASGMLPSFGDLLKGKIQGDGSSEDGQWGRVP